MTTTQRGRHRAPRTRPWRSRPESEPEPEVDPLVNFWTGLNHPDRATDPASEGVPSPEPNPSIPA